MKYNIEGNIDFYGELFNSLDKDENDDDNTCLITGLPLLEHYIKLECNHKFNYDALFTEIYKQKYKYKTYDKIHLSKDMLDKYIKSGKDYYIRCPYCRNIQFEILPYIEDKKNELYYGINTLDKAYYKQILSHYTHSYMIKGVTFELDANQCSYINCYSKYCAYNQKCKAFYCGKHYFIKEKEKLKQEKLEANVKLKQEKLEAKEKLKQEKLEAKEKLKQEKLEVKAKLKKEKPTNKVISNTTQISEYVPDNEFEKCSAILKSGPSKGNICSCKVFSDGLCKRHFKGSSINSIPCEKEDKV
jgi:hypothetical protein